MKSLLKKALSQVAFVPVVPELQKAEARCKSRKKNQSTGQLKRLRNEIYRKQHSRKATWKTFSHNKDNQSKPSKHNSTGLEIVSKVDPELIKLAKQINQTRREVFETARSRVISKKTKSVLFRKDYDNFNGDLKTLICS
ncbi:hypothetical protein EWB00_007323 [Schistosoma japonicum]|nr:SJCHGC01231 protein [Schistosoma japonicum]TNN08033.1 hypothetical protein EWB00_007323 [Schistosoma japonicum]TNN08034.1 hypothetical protein EWB00_007323 [Schistosoma japonicum]